MADLKPCANVGFAIYTKQNRHGNTHSKIVDAICFDIENCENFYQTMEQAERALKRMADNG